MTRSLWRRARTHASLMAGLVAALLLGACNDVLKVNAPQLIEESTLTQPANAPVLLAGTIADFECAFVNYIATMGNVADEFADSQANAAIWDIDRRTNFPSTSLYSTATCGTGGYGAAYTPVSVARAAGDRTLGLLQGWTDAEVPNRAMLIARAAAYTGYSLILLGEGFCSAAIDVGAELTPNQVFVEAENRFGLAIQSLTGLTGSSADSLRNLALVGRARARINQGTAAKRAEAVADATLVPNNFTFNARYSAATGRSENRIFRYNNTSGQITVDPTYRNLNDPRVPAVDANRSASLASLRLWTQQKYTSLTAPIPMASWREAILIRAEVAGGQEAVNLINQLRTRPGVGLAPFASTDAAAIQAQVQEERRRELYLESHRLFDTIRFNVPLNPAPGAPFPNGGGQYGNNKCLPLPDVERLNNPNIPRP
jgi:starch-binding outer membrane protein, SusD/RagB family